MAYSCGVSSIPDAAAMAIEAVRDPRPISHQIIMVLPSTGRPERRPRVRIRSMRRSAPFPSLTAGSGLPSNPRPARLQSALTRSGPARCRIAAIRKTALARSWFGRSGQRQSSCTARKCDSGHAACEYSLISPMRIFLRRTTSCAPPGRAFRLPPDLFLEHLTKSSESPALG
jgi:hypothetical protein